MKRNHTFAAQKKSQGRCSECVSNKKRWSIEVITVETGRRPADLDQPGLNPADCCSAMHPWVPQDTDTIINAEPGKADSSGAYRRKSDMQLLYPLVAVVLQLLSRTHRECHRSIERLQQRVDDHDGRTDAASSYCSKEK